MELEDLLPEKPEFKLVSTGKMYQLRLVNLEDHVWLKNKFGSSENFTDVMRNQDWSKAILFVYRLLVDKSEFMASEEPGVDDDGNPVKTLVTGPFKLLRAISGAEEAAYIMGALAKAIMLSNPMINDAVKEELKNELKKNSIGQKSSTSLQASTVGPQIQ
jgi:hypothetical protein